MNKKLQNIFFGFLLAFCLESLWGIDLPKPAGWVSDNAGVIDSQSYQKMDGVIRELEQKTGAEIAVVTVRNLGNDSIENFSVKLFQKWGIGKKGKDNGVLLVSSIEDRKVKIEVGYGLEGILPDGLCGQILDDYVILDFKKNEYGEGLSMGIMAIASVIAKDSGVELSGGNIAVDTSQKPGGSIFSGLFQFLIVLIIIIVFIRHPFLFLLFAGMSGRSRGDFGGGGFGGFGGGMSGGGGASRGW